MVTMMTLTPMKMFTLWNYRVTALLSSHWSPSQSVSSAHTDWKCVKYFCKMKQIFLCLILVTFVLCDETRLKTGKSLVRRRKLISSPNQLQFRRVINFHNKTLTSFKSPQKLRALVRKKVKKIIKSKSSKNDPIKPNSFTTIESKNSITNSNNRYSFKLCI